MGFSILMFYLSFCQNNAWLISLLLQINLNQARYLLLKKKALEGDIFLEGDILISMGMSFKHFAPKYRTDQRLFCNVYS